MVAWFIDDGRRGPCVSLLRDTICSWLTSILICTDVLRSLPLCALKLIQSNRRSKTGVWGVLGKKVGTWCLSEVPRVI